MLPMTSSTAERARVRSQLVRRAPYYYYYHYTSLGQQPVYARAGRRARLLRTYTFFFADQLRDVPIELPGTAQVDEDGRA